MDGQSSKPELGADRACLLAQAADAKRAHREALRVSDREAAEHAVERLAAIMEALARIDAPRSL